MGKCVSCLAAVILLTVTRAFAAQIETFSPPGQGDLSFIFFTGEIVKSDWQRFAEVSQNIPHAVVIFMKSPGGDLETALDIGALIRQRSYSTSAPDLCASACGLAWLAGFRRYMYPSSQIGFHAAYRGAGIESGVGNALVGAYLTNLKLSLRVIRYITTPAPNTVQWLSIRDAMVLGISIETPPLEKKQ